MDCPYHIKFELKLKKIILNKNVTGWHNLCNPVVDITPDMKATACFGAYSLIDLK